MSTRTNQIVTLLTLVLLLGWVLGACAPAPTATPVPPPPAPKPTEVPKPTEAPKPTTAPTVAPTVAATKPPEQITLTVWDIYPEGQPFRKVLDNAIARFNKQYPNVKVVVVSSAIDVFKTKFM
jgi:ABC-type glycerol-3-phosphate transport system substrate-binding protein